MIWGTILFWISSGFWFQEKPLIKVLIPESGLSSIGAPAGSIVGEYSRDSISTVQLLTPYQVWQRIDVVNSVAKESFPIKIRRIFSDSLVLERVSVIVFKLKGAKDSLEYRFGLDEDVDLRSFWSSTAFREILATVYDKKAVSSEVTLVGKIRSELSVASEEYQEKFGKIFSFSVPLHPGENHFIVRSTDRDNKLRTIDSIVFYRTTVMQSAPPDILESQFHYENKETECEPCHSLTVGEATIEEKSTVEEECITCHNSLVTLKSAHYPAASWDCLMCHDPSSTPKYQLYADKEYDATLCFECHSEREEELDTASVVHPPFYSGECQTCHDPHGSSNEMLIIDKMEKVCESCHEDIVKIPHPVVGHPLGGKPDPRDPEKEISCVSCHNPHASEHNFLLSVPRMQLCGTCHVR